MTVNYFMMTRDGLGLDGTPYPPFVVGSGPTTVDVTDDLLVPTAVRRNLIKNPSAETNDAYWFGPNTNVDRSTTHAHSGSASLRFNRNASGVGATIYYSDDGTASGSLPAVKGDKIAFSLYVRSSVVRGAWAQIEWRNGTDFISAVLSSPGDPTSTTDWTRFAVAGTAPTNTTNARLSFKMPDAANGEFHYADSILVEADTTIGTYFDGSTGNAADLIHGWAGTAHGSASLEKTVVSAPPTITGVPGDLVSDPVLGHRTAASGEQWRLPSGFHRSVFRVTRDPGVAGDDSGNSLGTQVYDHGWPLARLLRQYLYERSEVTWPLPDIPVVPVTGTPAASSGHGWHGLTAVTWPGSSVGVGTVRQVISGDEGSTRKVATILDALAALASTERTTLANNFTSNATAIEAAVVALHSVAGHWSHDADYPDPAWTSGPAWSLSDAVRYHSRAWLNSWLALAAVGNPTSDTALGRGVQHGICAVTALEHGLVGATFTSTHYQTLTGPIDAVVAMPSGY